MLGILLDRKKLAELASITIFLWSPFALADCNVMPTMPDDIYELIDQNDMSAFYEAVERQSVAGNPEAKYVLASKLKSEGPADEVAERMMVLLQESARAGYFRAQMSLGLLLYKREEYEEAYPYLRAVSECGAWGEAPYALSHMYQDGLGVPRDSRQAQCWKDAALRSPPFEPVSCE